MPGSRRFAVLIAAILATTTPAAGQQPDSARTDSSGRPILTAATLKAALDLIGLSYSDSELALLLAPRGQFGNDFTGRGDRRNAYDSIRAVPLANGDMPALFFAPLPPSIPIANRRPRFAARAQASETSHAARGCGVLAGQRSRRAAAHAAGHLGRADHHVPRPAAPLRRPAARGGDAHRQPGTGAGAPRPIVRSPRATIAARCTAFPTA